MMFKLGQDWALFQHSIPMRKHRRLLTVVFKGYTLSRNWVVLIVSIFLMADNIRNFGSRSPWFVIRLVLATAVHATWLFCCLTISIVWFSLALSLIRYHNICLRQVRSRLNEIISTSSIFGKTTALIVHFFKFDFFSFESASVSSRGSVNPCEHLIDSFRS